MNFGIWNSIDEVALYLGLERLEYETDEDLYNRIKKFSKWKYQTNYYTQAHSIPIQLGLDVHNIIEIRHSNPDKVFKCNLDWEYFTLLDEDDKFIRVFINTETCTLRKILDTIEADGTFQFSLIESKFEYFPTKYLIRNKNYGSVKYHVNSKGTLLPNKNIIPNTLSSYEFEYCRTRKNSIGEVSDPGDYFLDEKTGYLHIYEDNIKGFFVSYEYFEPRFIIEGSDVSLIPFNITSKYGVTDKLITLLPQVLDDLIWGR